MLAGVWLAPRVAMSQDPTGFLQAMGPYVAAAASYDSNLFRLSSDAEAERLLGTTQLSDTFYTVEAGLDGEFDVSQQNFVIDGYVYRNLYDRYSFNDYTGAEVDLTWNWKVAERWEGELGYLYDRGLQDYANQRNDIKNIRTRNKVSGKASFWPSMRDRKYRSCRWRRGLYSRRSLAHPLISRTSS